MTDRWQIEPISVLPVESAVDDRALPEDLESLAAESRREGYRFVDRMIARWRAGEFCFDRPGEKFFIVREKGALVACGGISIDPYLFTEEGANPVGRVRHLYVRPSDRGRGIGGSLLEQILAAGIPYFPVIRLRTTPDAARLYERFGFRSVSDETATHVLVTRGIDRSAQRC